MAADDYIRALEEIAKAHAEEYCPGCAENGNCRDCQLAPWRTDPA